LFLISEKINVRDIIGSHRVFNIGEANISANSSSISLKKSNKTIFRELIEFIISLASRRKIVAPGKQKLIFKKVSFKY
jgi:hypothetical protein